MTADVAKILSGNIAGTIDSRSTITNCSYSGPITHNIAGSCGGGSCTGASSDVNSQGRCVSSNSGASNIQYCFLVFPDIESPTTKWSTEIWYFPETGGYPRLIGVGGAGGASEDEMILDVFPE